MMLVRASQSEASQRKDRVAQHRDRVAQRRDGVISRSCVSPYQRELLREGWGGLYGVCESRVHVGSTEGSRNFGEFAARAHE